MRKLLILTTVLLSSGLFSCGGGGGGSNNGDTATGKRVVTKVEASIVKGATVCVENTDNCKQTDDSGTAILKVSHLPVTLTVKIANVVLGSVKADDTYVPITPLDIAGGDNQTAEKIGAFIHALVGDTTGTQTKIDLTNVKLKEEIDKPLVELFKSENITEPLSIEVETGNEIHTIEISSSGIIHDEEEVHYDVEEIQTLKEHEERLSELVEFFMKYDGKTIAFNDPEEQNSTCVLHVNPLNPLQFKFTDCVNPEDNDLSWEITFADEDGVKVVDEDGAVAYILDVELEAGKVKYKVEDDNGTWITGYLEVLSEQQGDQQSNESTFAASYLNIDAFKNKKLLFNNGNSYLVFDGNDGFKFYYNEDEKGDGRWIYDESDKSIVLWPGESFECKLWFSTSEPKIGTKMKISLEGGERIRYDQILSVQPNIDSLIGKYEGSYDITYDPNDYCDPTGSIVINVDKAGNVEGFAVTLWDYHYDLSGRFDFSSGEVSITVEGSDGSGLLKGKVVGNLIKGVLEFRANDGSTCNGNFELFKR